MSRRAPQSSESLNARDIEAYEDYLIAGGRSPRTIELRLWQLRYFAEHLPRPLRAATTAELAGFLSGRNWQACTIYTCRVTFRDFYKLLSASGKITSNPALGLPVVRVHQKNLLPAPEDAIAAALAAADSQTRLMIELAARQGLRRAEIAAVHTRDLFQTAAGWSLRVHGKGDKERLVPLHPDIAARLLACPRGWIFPSPYGGHLEPVTVGTTISRTLPRGWTAHSLRRRFATQVYNGSHDLRSVQLLLGHSNVGTTQLYIGTQPDELRNALGFS